LRADIEKSLTAASIRGHYNVRAKDGFHFLPSTDEILFQLSVTPNDLISFPTARHAVIN